MPSGVNKWDCIYKECARKDVSIWNESVTPWLASKIPYLKDKGVKKILDAGCGDGRNSLFFVQNGFEVVAVDMSKEAIVRAKYLSGKTPKVRYYCQDISRLEYENEFDAVICDYVFVHLVEPEKVIAGICDALKPRGFLLAEFLSNQDPACVKNGPEFTDGGIYHRFYTEHDVRRLLGQFKILKLEDMWHKDPGHGSFFPRNEAHKHHSIFVLAQNNIGEGIKG